MAKVKDLCLMTVLYVDDDIEVSNMFGHMFRINYPRHKIIHADNGFDALVKTRQFSPDLFIVNVSMPYVSGIQLAEEIVREGYLAPIVFLSAYDDSETIRMCKSTGCAGYFRKPIDFPSLFYELDNTMVEIFLKRLEQARLQRRVLDRL
ncbi:response regulator [Geomonas anaerohicana]|uniref:Response regulator n=1 Tax=Geomonas anaerohicana TaxID=2798583 RepID=A0ABS0YGB7_9BACT|nr:response regulator [Geomonas anaerohicana]MBJ6751373.1 response regulator [Geomonas anaerohicana]